MKNAKRKPCEDALIAVGVYFFRKGDRVNLAELEDLTYLGDTWEDHAIKAPEKPKPTGEDCHKFIREDDRDMMEVTSDFVGFDFHCVSEDPDCYIETYLGNTSCEEFFGPHKNNLLGLVGDVDGSKVVRIITIWHYWSESFEFRSDSDICIEDGFELYGRLNMADLKVIEV